MKEQRLAAVRRYLDCLHRSDIEGLISLFAPEGFVVSPFLGTMHARPFFEKLAQSSTRSVITPIELFAGSSDEPCARAAAYFRYDWTLKDGQVVTFKCMDVFEFEPVSGLFGAMTILYDTHPIREQVGDKYA
ncbi:nuclear transport factor 2 family protein [Schlegelella sp. S2-27]|uniref:Nuclear transport factor 2 family protein n=1 Tax=Caldimonas mangrovi TaxID=2944811 RepID=A0ABT0YNW7_9BURK|nr:nuclear transport factor 2 family protein [Caldimonas mangrovi]MCM5680422.1 nuclear transport factor 2 family protein [Caldimonas mangrovi]